MISRGAVFYLLSDEGQMNNHYIWRWESIFIWRRKDNETRQSDALVKVHYYVISYDSRNTSKDDLLLLWAREVGETSI